MNQIDKKFRFIPFKQQDVLSMLLDKKATNESQADWRQLETMLSSVFHFEFHKIVTSLKIAYAVHDPDADTQSLSAQYKPIAQELDFTQLLGGLLEKANYEQITEEDLNQALLESSLFKIRLHVDFDDFSEVLLFSRGETVRTEKIKTWFGLRSKQLSFTNYDRVVVYIRFRDDYQVNKRSNPNCVAGSTLLKLFQNVPKADLEMLFPNTSVRMRTMDKLLIGVPALISGGVVLTTKLGASLVVLGSLFGFWLGTHQEPVEMNKTAIMALLAGLAALLGYLWKQFSNFKNRKIRFMQALTQNLYFKNLDNNAGVFYRVANDAEEEECKESLLAYYFLLSSSEPLTAEELDNQIEVWLKEHWHVDIDFEIKDALNKLMTLNLLTEHNSKYKAVELKLAINNLDKRWDDYFLAGVIR